MRRTAIIEPVKKKARAIQPTGAEPPDYGVPPGERWQKNIPSILWDCIAQYHTTVLPDVRIKSGTGALQLVRRPV
jgi:hypothetical protein